MSKEYTYNPEHMDEISMLYKHSAEYTEAAIADLCRVKTHFLSNYQGQSDDMVADLFEKIKAHMELLQSCFFQMETYVRYTKDTMIELDNKTASTFASGGKV